MYIYNKKYLRKILEVLMMAVVLLFYTEGLPREQVAFSWAYIQISSLYFRNFYDPNGFPE